MENHRNAAKAFIVRNGKLLLIKRRPNDVHKPGAWDIPGGRLEPGEDPYEGLKREAFEEISGEIKIIMPIDVHHFTRDDGQKITLTIFLCDPVFAEIRLSDEHTEYKWLDLKAEIGEFPNWLHGPIKRVLEYNLIKQ
ncbi:MAG: NUDIX domain-containing protein [Candidatus Doudnabacteria bacterium]|nr:NUDIX domain-containing protein [Candidatus Doudnabacteria bacterium]